jgi:hypothetical protein
MIGKRTSQKTERRAMPRGHGDRSRIITSHQSGSLSPLTSITADSLDTTLRVGSGLGQVVCMYPLLPQTLRETASTEDGCRGMVAEPLN